MCECCMTVKELIEKLQACPQDSIVKAEIVSDNNSIWRIQDVWIEHGEVYLSSGW